MKFSKIFDILQGESQLSSCKNYNFRLRIFDYFHFLCSKHRLWVHTLDTEKSILKQKRK